MSINQNSHCTNCHHADIYDSKGSLLLAFDYYGSTHVTDISSLPRDGTKMHYRNKKRIAMKKHILTTVSLLLSCVATAQPSYSSYDTIPSRYRGYHYTEWYDQCPPYSNGGMIDSCHYEEYWIYEPSSYGSRFLKYEYTDHPMKLKGLAAMVSMRTYASYPYLSSDMGEQYMYLLKRIDWVDTIDHYGLDAFKMKVIDSVRFDTVKPKIMAIEQSYPGLPTKYVYIYEAYFDKPIIVDSVFYIRGTNDPRLHIDPVTYMEWYSYWPFDYAVIRLETHRLAKCEPYDSVVGCHSQGQNRSLEWIDVWAPGYYPPLDSNETWGLEWHFDPDDPYGYYLPIVDHYELKLYSDSLAMGDVEGAGYYDEDALAECLAVPNPGFVFRHWNDGVTQNPRLLHLSQDTAFTAFFAEGGMYHIDLFSNNQDMGYVTGQGDYPTYSNITISATPASNDFVFSHWNDGNTSNPRTLTLSQDTAFTAFFTERRYHAEVQSGMPEWGSAFGEGDYIANSQVTISASPANAHFEFSQWNDGDTNNPRTFTITQDTSFAALFNQILHANTAPAPSPCQFSVAPNPAKQTVTILNDNEGLHHADFYDSKGSLLLSFDYYGSAHVTDISSLPSGTYFILLSYNGNRAIRSFVKQ